MKTVTPTFEQLELELVPYMPEEIKKHVVRMENRFSEARYSMTAGQNKLLRIIFSLIDQNEKKNDFIDFREYCISGSLIKQLFGVRTKNMGAWMEDMLIDLRTKGVDIRIPGTKTGFITYPIISKATYYNGNVYVKLNRELMDFFIEVNKHYLEYDLHNVLEMSSSYSFRLYELMKQYTYIGKRIFNVEPTRGLTLQELLQAPYERYFDFKKNAILPAQKECAQFTDISFEFIEIKQGRKVVELEFIISSNTAAIKKSKIYHLLDESGLRPSLTDATFFENTCNSLKLDEAQIKTVISYIATRYNSGSIQKPFAWLYVNPEKIIKDILKGKAKVNINPPDKSPGIGDIINKKLTASKKKESEYDVYVPLIKEPPEDFGEIDHEEIKEKVKKIRRESGF